MLLESSTDTLIFIPEEDSKRKITFNKNDDPRVFSRCPKHVGMIGMVLKEDKIFISNFYVENMDHDSDVCHQKYHESSNKPCSCICLPIKCELFSHSIGAIQLVDKINMKSITDKDIGRAKALANLIGSLMSNICFISEHFRNFFEIKEEIPPVKKISDKLNEIYIDSSYQ